MRVSKPIDPASRDSVPTSTPSHGAVILGRQRTPSRTRTLRRVRCIGLPIAALLSFGCDESPTIYGAPSQADDGPSPAPGDSEGSSEASSAPMPSKSAGASGEDTDPNDGISDEPLTPDQPSDTGGHQDPHYPPPTLLDGGDNTTPNEEPPSHAEPDAGIAPPEQIVPEPDASVAPPNDPDDETPAPPGEDNPQCDDDEPTDEEPPVDPPWVSGLDERPPAPALPFPDVVQVAAPGWLPVDAFPALTFNTPTLLEEAPGTGHLFVGELECRLYAFENDPAATEKRLVLDLNDHCQGLEMGLLGMAFHPEFNTPDSPNRGYIYLHYPYSANPIVDAVPHPSTPTISRLARFTVDLDTLQIDPASEVVLIDQNDENTYHQGGPLFFHPDDGFLYYAVGDEGSHDCVLNNCQVINKDLFSGVLRIDVDMRGGDISHPIPRQPETGTTANYYIPNDNPFVGQPGVLEEFYAIGLREPHRMTYDPVDNITWIGDVGQSRIEELNVLRRGGNYQWAVLEGSLQVFDRQVPAEPLGIWTDPTLEVQNVEGAAIIGGYVYRGSKNPSLYGKYIFSDFVTGVIQALSYSYDGTRVSNVAVETLLASQFGRVDGIVGFGVDRNNELYLLPGGNPRKIYNLGRTEGFSNAPTRLSQTGVFVDTTSAELEASPGLIPYDVASPLWSDGAEKQRWASIPDGETIAFSDNGNWSFPDGSVFVKHFELALDASQPELKRRLETRILVQGTNAQFYGLTYKWNEAGTDADLLLERQIEPIDVTLANGDTRHLEYFYPGPNDCATCHNDDAGPVLGVRTSQLNHDMLYPSTGRVSNQLFTWGQLGLIDVALDQASVEAHVSLSALDDTDAPAEDRVRSYWASNCATCHRGPLDTLPGIYAFWDARFEVPLEDQGVIYGYSDSAKEGYIVVPGDAAASVLYQRSNSTLRGFSMPPIGRSSVDPTYVALLEEWITSLSSMPGN
jgi:uncharacterized repeat protein (TIGR03806 family)